MLLLFESPDVIVKLPPNNGSLTITFVTAAKSVLVTVIVYVIISPTFEIVVGLALFVILYKPPTGIVIIISTSTLSCSVIVLFAESSAVTVTILFICPFPPPLVSISFCVSVYVPV